jgi:glutathione S-transferase
MTASPIAIFTFGPAWGTPVPTSSPFGLKLLTWLRMHDLPHETRIENNPSKGPKGKCPWAVLGSEVIADSQLVIEAVQAQRSIEPDALSPHQAAVSTAARLMIEEHFHQVWEHELFIDETGWQVGREFFDALPPILRPIVRTVARSALRKQLVARGMARHDHAQIVRMGILDLDTLDTLLGDQPFFFGETPTDLDATAFGFLALVHWTAPRSPVWDHFRKLPRLGAHCERMLARYYPEASSAKGSGAKG